MKKLIVSVLILCVATTALPLFAQWRFTDDTPIVTHDPADVMGQAISEEVDPLRWGAKAIVEGVDGIYYNEDLYSSHDTGLAWERTTNYIKGLTNYLLALIGLVALIYLLFHGFLVLTAGAKEDQYDKWIQWIKYAAIALLGIGLAWLFLSLVFWLLLNFTK